MFCVHVTIEMLSVSHDLRSAYSKVIIAMVRHGDDDLVAMAKSGDELRDIAASSKTLKDLNLVLDPLRAAGVIDALEGDVDFGHWVFLQRPLRPG